MHTVGRVLLGGLSDYLLAGFLFGLITVINILRDRTTVRVLRISVFDLLFLFGLTLWLWPVQLWEWSNGDGPWRG